MDPLTLRLHQCDVQLVLQPIACTPNTSAWNRELLELSDAACYFASDSDTTCPAWRIDELQPQLPEKLSWLLQPFYCSAALGISRELLGFEHTARHDVSRALDVHLLVSSLSIDCSASLVR